ncbi:hypothetical protein E2562_010301 [Oryza meyeriana var. granulata]|uniref:Uncharacterized protein n=1 Tax=Oryza meyeriana var. granulata TaxID=110450 RepID=A0A6G1F689_9ORYZ|nr:hypothetical protein E2562_010301 [Oryza meyeriana var. granulata]
MVAVEADGEKHVMRRLNEGFVLYDVRNMKASSVSVMQSHLDGPPPHSNAAGQQPSTSAGPPACLLQPPAHDLGGRQTTGVVEAALPLLDGWTPSGRVVRSRQLSQTPTAARKLHGARCPFADAPHAASSSTCP